MVPYQNYVFRGELQGGQVILSDESMEDTFIDEFLFNQFSAYRGGDYIHLIYPYGRALHGEGVDGLSDNLGGGAGHAYENIPLHPFCILFYQTVHFLGL